MFNAVIFRWSLVTASAASAVALGFFLLPAGTALETVRFWGYYFILAATVSFAIAAYREFRALDRAIWSRNDWPLLAAALVVATIWQLNEIHGFKILMDELVLSATSMSMHFDRQVFVPLKADELEGDYFVFGGVLDKRPLFFPFLVSILHDVTGYRPENVFVLNGALSVALLTLLGSLGRILGGSIHAGVLAILLLAGVPLLGLNATGGGFDLLNAVMICAHLLLGIHYLRRPTTSRQDLLILATVLLAQTRYESAVFVGATGAVLVLGWYRQKAPQFSWALVAAPLLLLTIPLQNKLFTVHAGYWSSSLSDDPFSPRFALTNLGHAVNFLFSTDGFQGGSAILSGCGLVCTSFAVVFLLRRWSQTLQTAEHAAFLATALTIAANSLLVLFYFWGQLDDFVASRLALPLLFLFALASAFVLGRWFGARAKWFYCAIGVLAAWAWIFAIPFAAKSTSTRGFRTYLEVQEQMDFIRSQPGRIMFVLERPLPALIQRRPAMTVSMLNERAAEMAHHLDLGTYQDVFVLRLLHLDPVTRQFEPDDDAKLGPEFELETVAERQLQPIYKHRISRLKRVDLSRALPRPANQPPKYPQFRFLILADETPSGTYLREYYEKLP